MAARLDCPIGGVSLRCIGAHCAPTVAANPTLSEHDAAQLREEQLVNDDFGVTLQQSAR